MSSPSVEPIPGGHLEVPVAAQLARATAWDPSPEPVIDDLSEEDEADFVDAIAR